MRTDSKTLSSKPVSLLRAALLTGMLLAGAVMAMTIQRADAASGLCAAGRACGRDVRQPWHDRHTRYKAALQPSDADSAAAELSDQDFSAFSGIGVVSCTVDGKVRSSTAFLVGAFDIGVTVAHTFEKDTTGSEPTDCVYNSVDSLGQIRERIPVSYIRSQWQAEAGAVGQPAKDLAVVRLSKPSRYAQRTMPLGRFSGDTAPVVMIGYNSDFASDTVKRKARGTAFERQDGGVAVSSVAGFTHDMDSRSIAAGAPVMDERSGVIIGIHTRLPARRNAIITMNDWLEATLRREMQSSGGSKENEVGARSEGASL